MKITWASNAPWAASGYGTQTAQVLPRLLRDGHDVAVAANFGLNGRPITDPETGVWVFPTGKDVYGNDVMRAHHEVHAAGEPGWIITLFDVWVYEPERFRDANVASWTPVDHYPVPPKVVHWAKDHPTLAMSRFGEDALKTAGIDAWYAPHALDLDVWKPRPSDVRKRLDIPEDAFLVMINAANKGNVPPRKAWGEMLSAMSVLMGRHKDVYLYLHTDTAGQGGVDLVVLCAALGFPMERVRVPDQYMTVVGLVTSETLAEHYTAADVLLSTSMGEGFGLAVLEAQACGTPVIVTDFSAQPELVGAGWTVGFQPWWDFTQAAWLALPMVHEIVGRLEDAYAARGDASLREKALAKAAEYEADKVYADHWRPFLAELQSRLDGPKTRQQRRAQRRKIR